MTTRKARKVSPNVVVLDTVTVEAFKNACYARESAVMNDLAQMVGFNPMARLMLAEFVVKAAENVLRVEHRGSPGDAAAERAQYAKALKKARDTLGSDFDALYAECLKEHNEGARCGLDSSNGTLFCFVLPKFNPDGTHDPVGPKDQPWNRK
jgi:hypothetical protein